MGGAPPAALDFQNSTSSVDATIEVQTGGVRTRSGVRHCAVQDHHPHRHRTQLLVLDGAGWHVNPKLIVPDIISSLKLPPCSPELKPIENVWAYLRGTKLARRWLNTDDDIVNACREAWNSLLADADTVRSITTRRWAMCQKSWPVISYQLSEMLTHVRRVTPHGRRRAFALASGQLF